MNAGRTAALLAATGTASAGRLVAEVRLPGAGELPRVLLCGARVFVRDGVAPHPVAFVEASVAQLPELAP